MVYPVQTPRRLRVCFTTPTTLPWQRHKFGHICTTNVSTTRWRSALPPTATRATVLALLATGAVLRVHGGGHLLASRTVALCALAASAVLVVGTSPQRNDDKKAVGRFATSRAMWTDDDDDDDNVATAPTRGGLLRAILDGSRNFVATFMVPLIDALRLLIADMRTASEKRNTSFFKPPPPRIKRKSHSQWSWTPPSPSPNTRASSDDMLTEEERQIKLVGDAAREAAKTARKGATSAGRVFKSFLDRLL